LPEADLRLLEDSVRAAGAIARRYYGGSFRRWSKEGGSPVTEADLEIDAFLKAHLTAARPGYAWLSEESADDPARLKADTVFIVDPIDGTTAFVKARPHFTICAAVTVAGAPVAGVVYNPIADEMFCAVRGQGATLNGASIHVAARQTLEGACVLGEKARLIAPLWPAMTVESRNSAAYRLALVAAGRFDAVISTTIKRDWDLAAADLICREAGGHVSDRTGAPLRYNLAAAAHSSVIAANPALHAAILPLVA
jgi:myo-inositol-1(or 4)-monophosphatase